MEFVLTFDTVNWMTVLAATIVVFLLGGIWYSPVMFGRPGIMSAQAESRGGPARAVEAIFFLTFLFQWMSASLLAAILGPNTDTGFGLSVGLLVGVFFVSTAFGVSYVFERRPFAHLLVNGGYQVVSFAAMGAIIGTWH